MRYRVQLDYYEEALVRLTGKCVKEKLESIPSGLGTRRLHCKMEEFYYQKMGQAEAGRVSRHAAGRPAAGGSDSAAACGWKELYDNFFPDAAGSPGNILGGRVFMEILPRLPNLIFVPEYLFEKGKIKSIR